MGDRAILRRSGAFRTTGGFARGKPSVAWERGFQRGGRAQRDRLSTSNCWRSFEISFSLVSICECRAASFARAPLTDFGLPAPLPAAAGEAFIHVEIVSMEIPNFFDAAVWPPRPLLAFTFSTWAMMVAFSSAE